MIKIIKQILKYNNLLMKNKRVVKLNNKWCKEVKNNKFKWHKTRELP